MSVFDAEQNIVFRKRLGTIEDPYVPVTHQVTIINGYAPLWESVDKFQGITITKSGVTYAYKEIKDVKYNETLPDATTFVYNAELGYLNADTSFNNQIFTVSYWGKGSYYLNGKRVFLTIDGSGNIVETLDSKITNIDLHDATYTANENLRISAEATRASNENTRISQETTRQTQESTRQTNTTNAINNLNTAYNTTVIIPKTPVANFAAIASTYPSPQVGWEVVTLDTGNKYRWDGVSTWINNGNVNRGGVLVGSSQPSDTSIIWVDINA